MIILNSSTMTRVTSALAENPFYAFLCCTCNLFKKRERKKKTIIVQCQLTDVVSNRLIC